MAAEPILTGPQADRANAAAAAAAITNTEVRGTTASLLVWASGGRPVRRNRAALAEHRLDELSAPGKQLPVAQERGRRPGAGTGCDPGHRYEHRTHCWFDHRLRVQPLRPHLPGFWQVHWREPDMGALLGDVGQPGLAGLRAEAGHGEQAEHRLGQRAAAGGRFFAT